MEMTITIEQAIPGEFHVDKYVRTLAWDATASAMVEAIAGVLLSMGYSHNCIMDAMEEYIGERR